MRTISIVGVSFVVVLIMLCTPLGSQVIYKLMIKINNDIGRCPVESVVVLGGGYIAAKDHEDDQLNGETALRLLKGVRVFRECHAKQLVVSGRTHSGDKYRQGQLMKDMAVQYGVPKDIIVMETDSMNTREHPIYIHRMGILDGDDRIAVVTSPWHMRRAMIEFHRYYSDVMPIDAYYIPTNISLSFPNWLPQTEYLDRSAKMVQELIGVLWYKVLHEISA